MSLTVNDKRHKQRLKFLYTLVVAGKSAEFANEKVEAWRKRHVRPHEDTFTAIRRLKADQNFVNSLREVGTGNYNKIDKAMDDALDLDKPLFKCSPEDLEEIHGVGPKTSRFFLVWATDRDDCAVLDTHVLDWMADQGYDVPEQTPSTSSQYKKIEKDFIKEAEKRGTTPRELDLDIWEGEASAQNEVYLE